MKTKRSHAAFSLIEAAIVLGIVGLVIGGIWIAASSVSQKNKVNRTVEQVTIVLQNIRAKLMQNLDASKDFTFYNGPCATNELCMPRTGWNGYLPSDMINNASDYPLNIYGGFFIATLNTTGISIVLYLGDNVQACAQIGPRLYNLMAKERNADALPFTISTAAGGYDLSSPNGSGTGCQNEYDNEGQASVAFTLAQ